MILKLIINPIYAIIIGLLTLLPTSNLFPDSLIDSVNHVLDVIFSHLDWLGMFVRIDTIRTLVPLIIFVVTFEYTYRIIMWVIKKIPFIGID